MRHRIQQYKLNHSITFTLNLFVITLFLVLQLSAQDNNDKKKSEKSANVENPNSTQVFDGEVSIKAGTNTLLKFEEEGPDGGSIFLPDVGASPVSNTGKLYNKGGDLLWSGTELGASTTFSDDWDDDGSTLFMYSPTRKVGIGTLITETTTKLHVKGDEGVLFQGTYGNGTAFNFGAGTRFHFYSRKAAIRSGIVDGTQWDDANIGAWSTAFGNNNIASASASTAFGLSNSASGLASTVTGASTSAIGNYSFAAGLGTKAESWYSAAFGAFNLGGGNPSTIVDTDPVFEVGIGTNDANRANAITVLKNGKVGIGTNSTTYRVEIKAETGEDALKVKVNNSGKLTVFSNGGTSIGTDATAPANGLLVSGNINNTGGLLHASDLRFKTNIKVIPNTLERIQKLRGVYYDWKRNEFPKRNFNDKKQIGVIAQEVEKEFPELVSSDDEGYKSVDYTKLSAVLIEAVKQQNFEFRNENTKLHETIKELENRLAKLESLIEGKKFANISSK